jgi:VWFA-related protein
MRLPNAIRLFLVVLLTAGAAAAQFQLPAFPQTNFPPPPPDPKELRIAMDVENVLLDVSVRDKQGQWVSGLKQENFKILENGEPQKIGWFTSQDIPVTLGIVLDNSGSMRPKRAEAVTAALAFIKTSNPHDEIFIVTFNERVRMGLPPATAFTDNPILLRDALIATEPSGRTALYDALSKALTHGDSGKHGRKALLVISDGGDNASAIDWNHMHELAMKSKATIFTIGVFSPDDKERNPGVLRRLTDITGGESYMPKKLEDLSGICEQVARDIRNRYVLSYTPEHHKAVGRERKIEVTAHSPERGKMSVNTRSRYLASEPSSPEQKATAKKTED